MVVVKRRSKHRTTLRRLSAASRLHLLRRLSDHSQVAACRRHKPARTCSDAKARKKFFARAQAAGHICKIGYAVVRRTHDESSIYIADDPVSVVIKLPEGETI